MQTEEIITDEQIEIAWGNANFGNISKREVIFETLQKFARGYSTGRTACLICNELGLALGEKLSELGYKYLIATEIKSSLSTSTAQVEEEGVEKILCAAIWYKDLPNQNMLAKNIDKGLLICGHRHGQCIDIVKSLAGLRTVQFGPDAVGETVQGFLTNLNRFVDRQEAWGIAKATNQIIQQSGGKGTLYSEDLY